MMVLDVFDVVCIWVIKLGENWKKKMVNVKVWDVGNWCLLVRVGLGIDRVGKGC